MERLLARLERRFGGWAIPNLTAFLVGGMAIVFVLTTIRHDFFGLLTLDLPMVRHGQVWRLVTYLFLPDTDSPIWILLSLYWLWLVASNLEHEWGSFKLNVYYLVGMIGTTIAAWISGGAVGNLWLNSSLVLAFATVFPDFEIYFFFILRLKVKWLGFLLAGFLVFQLVTGDWVVRAAIIAAMSNYFLFFSGHLMDLARRRNVQVRQTARMTSMRPAPVPVETRSRQCAICGKREEDGADIRVCSCARCGGKPRELCLEHARNH